MKPLINLEDDSQRFHFRVEPSQEDPVTLKVAGNEVPIINLSAQGVAFLYPHTLTHSSYPAELLFTTDRTYTIHCDLILLRRQPPEYSGSFSGISEQDTKKITRLVMECQKRNIRHQKEQEHTQ